jgi:hypothetical protein
MLKGWLERHNWLIPPGMRLIVESVAYPLFSFG